jgi:hypothetical protein
LTRRANFIGIWGCGHKDFSNWNHTSVVSVYWNNSLTSAAAAAARDGSGGAF